MIRILLISVVIVPILLLSYARFVRQAPSSHKIVAVSPDGLLKVSLVEEIIEKKPELLNTYQLFLSLVEKDIPLITRKLIGRYNSMDGRFSDRYPSQYWLENNIVSFSQSPRKPQPECDELSIVNNNEQTITWLLIQVGNKEEIMAMRLKPHTRNTIYIQPQTDKYSDYSWIGASCLLTDNTQVPDYSKSPDSQRGGKNFSIRGLYKTPAHYSLIVNGDSIAIRSQEFSIVGNVNEK
jgi:hypothetical protein